jgi:hypothetical protein
VGLRAGVAALKEREVLSFPRAVPVCRKLHDRYAALRADPAGDAVVGSSEGAGILLDCRYSSGASCCSVALDRRAPRLFARVSTLYMYARMTHSCTPTQCRRMHLLDPTHSHCTHLQHRYTDLYLATHKKGKDVRGDSIKYHAERRCLSLIVVIQLCLHSLGGCIKYNKATCINCSSHS